MVCSVSCLLEVVTFFCFCLCPLWHIYFFASTPIQTSDCLQKLKQSYLIRRRTETQLVTPEPPIFTVMASSGSPFAATPIGEPVNCL